MQTFIKKLIAILLSLVSFALTAQPDNVPVTVKDVSAGSEYIVYSYKNTTNKNINSSSWVKSFEKNIDGEWISIEFEQEILEVGYTVMPTETDKGKFKVNDLTAGEYRLTIAYTVIVSNGKSVTGTSSVIFDVTE